MTDIATLGLRVDSSQLARGTQALDRLGDQATMTERQTTQASRRMTAGFAASGAAAAGMGRAFNANNTRMFAMQLSQVAQQAQAGGGVLRALSIQAADIGMAFGTIGIAAGVAAGALLPFIGNMLQLERDTRSTTERVDDLTTAFNNLEQAQDLASMSATELVERYGVVNEQIRRLVANLEQAALTGFSTAAREAIAGFTEIESAVGTALSTLQRLETQSGRNLRATELAFSRIPGPVQEAAAAVQNFATSGQEELSVQRDRALEAAEALMALNDPDYQGAISNLLSFADVASQQLGRVRAEAASTASALSALGGRGSGRGEGPQGRLVGTTGNGFDWRAEGALDQADQFLSAASSRGGGGGGGGGSSGAREITAAMRAADQAIRQAQEAAVQFGDVQSVLNERLASGAIDLETYNAALDQAREKYEQVGEATEFWQQQQQALKDGILDAIVNGENLAETFQNIARSIARAALEAALFGSGPLAGPGSGTGIFNGLFQNIFGRASGGPVAAGQPYIVGEKRPELFVPNQSGRILPEVPGGGAVRIKTEVHNYAGADVQTDSTRAADGTVVERITIRAVNQAIGEGRFDRAMGARFGSRPQRIRQ